MRSRNEITISPVPPRRDFRRLACAAAALVTALTAQSAGAQNALDKIMCNPNNTNNTIAFEMRSMGACSPQNQTAAKVQAIQNNLKANQQMLNSTGNLLIGMMQLLQNNAGGNEGEASPRREIDPAAAEAARRQKINAEAASLLESANALVPSPAGRTTGTSAQNSPNAAVVGLLDDTPSDASTSTVSALLQDSSQQNPADSAATTTVNGLLADSDSPPAAASSAKDSETPRADPFYQPPAIDKNYGAGLTFPVPDREMAADLGDSEDQPDPSMFSQMKQAIQSGIGQAAQQVKDRLTDLVSPAQSLIAPVMNDRGIQWLIHDNRTTLPTALPTDSPDRMADLTLGQGQVGMGKLAAGPFGAGPALKKMVDQGNADLVWAQANVGLADGE